MNTSPATSTELPRSHSDGNRAEYDHAGHEPNWEVPARKEEGWTPPRTTMWSLRSHPQETTENSVDIGHFRYVHGYRSIEILSDLTRQLGFSFHVTCQ